MLTKAPRRPSLRTKNPVATLAFVLACSGIAASCSVEKTAAKAPAMAHPTAGATLATPTPSAGEGAATVGPTVTPDASPAPTDMPVTAFLCDADWITRSGAAYGVGAADLFTDKHLQGCINFAAAAGSTQHKILLPESSRWLLSAPITITASDLDLETATGSGDTFCFTDAQGDNPAVTPLTVPTYPSTLVVDLATTNTTTWPSSYGLSTGPVQLRNTETTGSKGHCATLIAAKTMMMCGGSTDVASINCQQLANNASQANLFAGLDPHHDLGLINIMPPYALSTKLPPYADDGAHNTEAITNVTLRHIIIDGNAYAREQTWSIAFPAAHFPNTTLSGPCINESEYGCDNLYVRQCDGCTLDGIVSYNVPSPSLSGDGVNYNGTAYNVVIDDSAKPTMKDSLILRSGSIFPIDDQGTTDFYVSRSRSLPARANNAFTMLTSYRDATSVLITNNYVIDGTDGSLTFEATGGHSMSGPKGAGFGVFNNFMWQWNFIMSGASFVMEAGVDRASSVGTGRYNTGEGHLEVYGNTVDCNKSKLPIAGYTPASGGVARLCVFGFLLGDLQYIQASDTASTANLMWQGGMIHGNHVINARTGYSINDSILPDLGSNPPTYIGIPYLWDNDATNAAVAFTAFHANFVADVGVTTTVLADGHNTPFARQPNVDQNGKATSTGVYLFTQPGQAQQAPTAGSPWDKTLLWGCAFGNCPGSAAP